MTRTLPVTGAAPQFAKPTVPAEHIKKEALMELSCQLYSARMTPDWPQIMSGLAVRGFGAVEGFPTFYDDPVSTRAMPSRLSQPLVRLVRWRIVAKAFSMGFEVRMLCQCWAGKS